MGMYLFKEEVVTTTNYTLLRLLASSQTFRIILIIRFLCIPGNRFPCRYFQSKRCSSKVGLLWRNPLTARLCEERLYIALYS